MSTGRRASAINLPSSLSSQQTTIPILNEPGMQPLLPLLPVVESKQDSFSTNIIQSEQKNEETGTSNDKVDNEEKKSENLIIKPNASPQTIPITLNSSTIATNNQDNNNNNNINDSNNNNNKSNNNNNTISSIINKSTGVNVIELNENDLNYCSELFFFIRDHPEIIIDLFRCCDNLQVKI